MITTHMLTPAMRRVIGNAIYRSNAGRWQLLPVMSGGDGRVLKALRERQLATWHTGWEDTGAVWLLTPEGERLRNELFGGAQ